MFLFFRWAPFLILLAAVAPQCHRDVGLQSIRTAEIELNYRGVVAIAASTGAAFCAACLDDERLGFYSNFLFGIRRTLKPNLRRRPTAALLSEHDAGATFQLELIKWYRRDGRRWSGGGTYFLSLRIASRMAVLGLWRICRYSGKSVLRLGSKLHRLPGQYSARFSSTQRQTTHGRPPRW